MKFIYFGTPQFASIILDELLVAGYQPALIVTSPDKPAGRKLILTPSPVKLWGLAHEIPVITPESLRDEQTIKVLEETGAEVFVVAAYGKLIPQKILDIPPHGALNVHPSMLPLLRGPSPIESAITSGQTSTGVTIMKLDALMDHGPILAQEDSPITWTANDPPLGSVLESALAHQGGKLLAQTLPRWIQGTLKEKEQEHDKATICKKITKEDGRIDIHGDAHAMLAKIRAYDVWPGAFFFVKHGERELRIRITAAHIEENELIIDRIIPEGKKEMSYADFKRGLR